MRRVGLMCLAGLLSVGSLFAQSVATLTPEVKDIIADQVKIDRANAVVEGLAFDVLKKTPEYQRYIQAQGTRQKMQAELQKRVQTVAPGLQLNFTTYQLEPAKPKE